MRFHHFPVLIPAFTAQIRIDVPLKITDSLLCIPFMPKNGTLRSESGYPMHLDVRFVHGSDYLQMDPDGDHVRLDVRSTAQDVETGALVLFRYQGIVDITGPEGKVIRGEPDAVTTGFGNVFVQVNFETDAHRIKRIGNKVYVGSGRFIVEEGRAVTVEYKISEVTAACEDWWDRPS